VFTEIKTTGFCFSRSSKPERMSRLTTIRREMSRYSCHCCNTRHVIEAESTFRNALIACNSYLSDQINSQVKDPASNRF